MAKTLADWTYFDLPKKRPPEEWFKMFVLTSLTFLALLIVYSAVTA